jgi:hypothetical protein
MGSSKKESSSVTLSVRFTLVVIQSAHHPYCLQDGRRRNTRR